MSDMGAKTMKTISTIIAATFLGCASAPTQPAAPPPEPAPAAKPAPPAPVPDHQLGLSKTSVADVPEPAAFSFPTADPGENKPYPRGFPGAPPMIPHDVQGFLPITVEENNCLACHQVGEAAEGDPPAVPASHATDLRAVPDKVTEEVIGARWRCVACHLPQAPVTPLVQSTFAK